MVTTARYGDNILQEIRTAVRHMAVYGAGNIMVKALGFLMLPFYTRYPSPKDYGVLEILDLSMSVFALVLNMGLTPAFLRVFRRSFLEELIALHEADDTSYYGDNVWSFLILEMWHRQFVDQTVETAV
jgi:hypothetical protein